MTFARTDGHLRAVLRGRSFRRLLGVRLISQFSDALFQGGLAGSLLFNPTDQTSPVAIATGFAVLLLPYSLIGPYVGVVLDRWSRQRVISACNLVRAAVVLPAAAYIWHGDQSTGYVTCALLVIGINRLLLSGVSASQPHVVPQPQLVTANAVSGTVGTVVYSLGLGTSVLLLNVVLPDGPAGYGLLASLASIGYLGSALLCLASFGRHQLGPEDEQTAREPVFGALYAVARGMVAGVAHLARRRGPAYGVLTQSAHRLLYGILTLATLLLFRRYFFPDSTDKALSGLGALVVVGGLGALAAAFVTPWVTRHIGGWRWVALLLCAVGLGILGLGLPFRPALLVSATFVVNFMSQSMKIVVDTAIQTEVADDFRGRVFSVNDTLFNVCYVTGLFVAARTLPVDGHSATMLVTVACGYLVVGLWRGVALGRRRAAHRAAPTAELTLLSSGTPTPSPRFATVNKSGQFCQHAELARLRQPSLVVDTTSKE